MRRGLLTVGAPAAFSPVGATVPVNARDVFTGAGMYCVWGGIPAAADGTITTVTADFNANGTVAFFTISPTNVIRAITANMTASSGLNDYSVSLAIQTGDYLGVWMASAAAAVWIKSQAGVSTFHNDEISTKPAVGNTRATSDTESNTSPALRGTG